MFPEILRRITIRIFCSSTYNNALTAYHIHTTNK
uniref:Uncharacterized protein n=1 Tax=Anguilla anguilla TaxID=7936 RepID=A0A0E9XUZ3_ANGAN